MLEKAELVYEAVANDNQANPLAVNSRVDDLSKVVNPYTVGLRTDTDSTEWSHNLDRSFRIFI